MNKTYKSAMQQMLNSSNIAWYIKIISFINYHGRPRLVLADGVPPGPRGLTRPVPEALVAGGPAGGGTDPWGAARRSMTGAGPLTELSGRRAG